MMSLDKGDKETVLVDSDARLRYFTGDKILIDKKEYQDLLLAANVLNALEGAGVDNWSGYDDAREMLDE